ncbi:MAG: hypothetical protein LBR55_03125 [Bacteroidales bacterium]|jgi:outer membrane protein OmpA-like peptidoglycan-associated protein|nr:hypothetical protein [Bacteroidales bacterium]
MRKIVGLVVIVCCSVQLCYAQSYDVLLQQANTAYSTGDYETAIELYESMMQVYEKIPYLRLQCAHAYRLNLQYNEARVLYQSLSKTAAEMYHEVLFWIAYIEQLFGNKSAARYYYNRYVSTNHSDYYERAVNELRNLQFAPANSKIEIIRDGYSPFFHNYGVSLLNNNVVYNGVKPTATSSYITFAPLEKKYEQLFADSCFSYSDLQNVQSQVYVARRPAHLPFEKAELCLVCDSAEIVALQPVENQPFANNKENSIHVYFAHYNHDDIVFFASDRQGGFGTYDIWYCQADENGVFGEPINAGNLVNSAGDEMCPFFDAATGRLYFSSDWHSGMGGFDVFYAETTLDFLQFTPPQNMGMPVNSSFNDFYYKQLRDKAYFTSNRPQKAPEKTDYFYNSVFYYVSYPSHDTLDTASPQKNVIYEDVTGQTRNDSKNKVSEFHTTLFFRHDFPNEQSVLNYDDEYAHYKAYCEEQLAQLAAADFSISNTIEEKQLREFVSNQLTAHVAALQQEIHALAQNSATDSIMIELQAFTSASGNNDYNEKLALRRTESVKNYISGELYKAGIAPSSIVFYEKPPVIQAEKTTTNVPESSLKHAHERRVDVRILVFD